MGLRIFYTLLLFCLLPFFPWWAIVSLALIGLFIFSNYWEVIFIFLLYDLMIGLPLGWLDTQFTFTVAFSVVYLIVEGLRDNFIVPQH